MTTPDRFSGRIIAQDAAGVLESFRSAGGRSFHTYPVEQVRELYEKSCAANGLAPDQLASVRDFTVGEFATRIYEPRTADGNTPAIVFFHGGGWVMGSLSTHDGLCRRLASRTQLPVVAVDYRLAPEHPYPAAIDDSRAALRWLFDSDEHGLDVSGAVLVGDSAGGQLVAVLTNENATAKDPRPVFSQVLLYPMVDLTMGSDSYERVTEGFPLVADTIAWFANLYVPEGVDRSASDVSPARGQIPTGLPPTYVITVDNDPLVDEGAEYAASLAEAGTELLYQHLPGYAHGLFTSAGRIPRGELTIDQIASFITDHTRGR